MLVDPPPDGLNAVFAVDATSIRRYRREQSLLCAYVFNTTEKERREKEREEREERERRERSAKPRHRLSVHLVVQPVNSVLPQPVWVKGAHPRQGKEREGTSGPKSD